MHDPFPVSSPAFLRSLSQPLADWASLQTLPYHVHEVLFAFVLYELINAKISPYLSRRLFPRIYPHFNKRTKLNWDVHVVSLAQSTLINVLAIWVCFADRERAQMNWKERVWGYTGAGGLVQGFACGYFVWDLYISMRYVSVFGWGLLAHAISALLVFSLGFRPFLNYYGPTFILYELSSPFLNIHWFCDKLSLTGSNLQLYNGIALILTFFSCRLAWGTWQTVYVYHDVWRALMHVGGSAAPVFAADDDAGALMRFAGTEHIPAWLALSYLAANVTLHALNFYWFGKMIETVRKRFDPPLGTRGVGEGRKGKADKEGKAEGKEQVLVEGIDVDTDTNGDDKTSEEEDAVAIAKGVYADGRKTVELEKTEVLKRRR